MTARDFMDTRSYRIVNWIALGAALYGLVLPLLAPGLDRTLPGVTPVCALRALTGWPCPMCGLTRALGLLLRGHVREASATSILAVPFLILLVGELVFRCAVLAGAFRPARLPRLARLDLRAHLVLIALYLAYGVFFFVHSVRG